MYEEYEGYPVASCEKSWQRLLADEKVDVVRNEEDWNRSFDCGKPSRHPLAKSSEREIAEFTKSLVFNNGGLAHANYRSLRNSLTLSGFDRLGAMFGISPILMADYNNMKCSARATCSTSITDICTSNC